MDFKAVVIVLAVISLTSAFKLPQFDDITGLFQSLHEKRDTRLNRARHKRSRPNIGDRSGKVFEVETDDIPRHKDPRGNEILHRYMPSLGNGHIATTVYNYTLFMNNYYSKPVGGKNGEVHRVAIPAKIMYRVNFTDFDKERNARRTYRFNVEEGYFEEQIDATFATIRATSYVHRLWTSLFITHLNIQRIGDNVGTIKFEQAAHHNETSDLDFQAVERFEPYGLQQRAVQRATEDGDSPKTLYLFWTEVEPTYKVGGSDGERNITHIMSIHTDQTRARLNFEAANQLINRRPQPGEPPGPYVLFTTHANLWRQTWERTGQIIFDGNLELTKMARFGMYNLLSALPALESTETQENDDFSVLSRSGLGRGAIGKDYQGHVFWDSEMYILPALVFFRPDVAKRLLRYRLKRSSQASNLAIQYGDEGYRYPWESASVGNDVTPDNGATCRDQQIHINGAISFAARTYWSATRDESARTTGEDSLCDLTKKLADFFFKRTVYNTYTRRFHIEGIMGPDDSHPNISNNAYTNAIASLTLHWSHYYACICGRGNEIPQEYLKRAIELYMPYNDNSKMHFAFQDMEKRDEQNLTFKQADTTLLGFPLLWNMSSLIQKTDLEYYSRKLISNPPGMSHAFSAAGYVMAGDKARANEEFSRATSDYIAQPFHVWTEYREDTESEWLYSSTNFLPAIGAFLQASVSGWAGLRLRPEQIDIHRAIMPINTQKIRIEGFKYLGNNLTFDITESQVQIECHNRQTYTLRVRRNSTKVREDFSLDPGEIVELNHMADGYILFAVERTNCDVPADYIETIYSPWVNAAEFLQFPLQNLLLALLIMVLNSFTNRY